MKQENSVHGTVNGTAMRSKFDTHTNLTVISNSNRRDKIYFRGISVQCLNKRATKRKKAQRSLCVAFYSVGVVRVPMKTAQLFGIPIFVASLVRLLGDVSMQNEVNVVNTTYVHRLFVAS